MKKGRKKAPMKQEFPQELGDRILCMDCLQLMEQLPDGVVSLILTDPPYGIRYQNQFASHPHPLIRGDDGIDYERFAAESYRILRMDSHAYFFTRYDCYPHHYRCLKAAGFSIKNCLVIEKGTIGGIGDLNGSFANNAEWLIFCQKGRRVFNHTTLMENRHSASYARERKPYEKYKTRFPCCWFGPDYPKSTHNSVWQKQHQVFHPTVKNTACLSWLIQISSNPGELVFDGFMGSGSTALAALETGRRYLGAEICPEYCQTALDRISKWRQEAAKQDNQNKE